MGTVDGQQTGRDQATKNAFQAKPPQKLSAADPPRDPESPFNVQAPPAVAAPQGGTLYKLGTPNGALELQASIPIKTFEVSGDRGFTLKMTCEGLTVPLEFWTDDGVICSWYAGAVLAAETVEIRDPKSGAVVLTARLTE